MGHANCQLKRVANGCLRDDFDRIHHADVDPWRVRPRSPSHPQQPSQVLLHCPATDLARIILDGGGARTHLAQRGSHWDALKELLPQPGSVRRGRNKQ